MAKVYKNVLVATDGSKEANNAFKKAANLAANGGDDAKLVITHIVDTPSLESMGGYDKKFIEKITKDSKESLNELKKKAENIGVKNIETDLEYGSPKQLIAYKVPKDKNIDLLVIGATGLNGFEKLLIGSVTSFAVRNAVTDVLVTK